MNYILHLTDRCNLRCKYCYETKKSKDISFENVKKIIDREIELKSDNVIISFYGGEPLLRKDLIYDIINYINSKETQTKFYFGMTTNGTLLDDEFINLIKQNNFLNIAYSFDGKKETQDLNRVTIDSKGTFDIVESNAKKLLNNHKLLVAMVVVTKNNIKMLKENIEYLIELGFKQINLLFNYLQDWQDDDLKIIKKQFKAVAKIYYNKFMEEDEISILQLDDKINTYINNKNCNHQCNLGMKSINVGTDGNYYPCMQFVGENDYVIGNCKNGVDLVARLKLKEQYGFENNACTQCSIRERCQHTCACVNYMITKNINEISPIVCEYEKILVEISDELAEKLYKNKSKLFMQKFYNKKYFDFKKILKDMETDK